MKRNGAAEQGMGAHGSAGFTVLELVVSVAVMAVVGVIIGRNFLGSGTEQGLKAVGDELRAVVQNTERRAMSQENQSAWGVHFMNYATSGSTYAVFYGSSYASGTVDHIYALDRNIQFADPSVGASKDVVFQKLTGLPGSFFSVTLLAPTNQSLQRVVSVNAVGTFAVTDVTGLSLSGITPSVAPNNATLSVTSVQGTNFSASSTFLLAKSGQSNIPLAGTTVVNSSLATGGTLALTGASIGSWDLVVSSAGSTSTLANAFTVRAPAPAPTTLSPANGYAGSSVSSVSVGGNNFQSGATAKLSRSGQPDIPGSGFTFVSATSLTSGTFNLTGAATGLWDLVVTNPDGQSGTLSGAFTILAAAGPSFDIATAGSNVNGGSCTGSVAWSDTQLCLKVPAGTPSGSDPLALLSNTFLSNTLPFSVP